ncbi:hypothetical protein B0T25DRAFT_228688 [Lasiosphaeria hispida]|uniref:Uncharacterized protein n=1 Tax=Lasiosphaeria hispida TaxID=260671 RepID=A0AAJ0HDY5_9PEZI|nr:hypothetical protein B0T25DRAFT_228688 [Lasiosphaeria hispida]
MKGHTQIDVPGLSFWGNTSALGTPYIEVLRQSRSQPNHTIFAGRVGEALLTKVRRNTNPRQVERIPGILFWNSPTSPSCSRTLPMTNLPATPGWRFEKHAAPQQNLKLEEFFGDNIPEYASSHTPGGQGSEVPAHAALRCRRPLVTTSIPEPRVGKDTELVPPAPERWPQVHLVLHLRMFTRPLSPTKEGVFAAVNAGRLLLAPNLVKR